jgi:geranylgeranyl pyrophosphate synthase
VEGRDRRGPYSYSFQRLTTILNKHTEENNEVTEAIEILRVTGSIDYARTFAKELVEKAWRGVENVLTEGTPKESLRVFANYLIERSI